VIKTVRLHYAMMTTKSTLFRFVLIIGIVNLFADFTYEGGRSIIGPFLGVLGASGTIVGFVGGFGEFMGYAIRSVSGYVADKTGKYWATTFVGYVINMFAVPALALAGNWPAAALLIVMERTGRAIRRPAVEAMLSYTTEELGRGWVFGLNEALDQVGATAGPLLVALILFLKGGYRSSFAILLVPALLCISTLTIARFLYPQPRGLEKEKPRTLQTKGFSGAYWTYLAAGALIAAGFTGFSLISFHFQKAGTVTDEVIPILFAVAMATAAVTALVFGRLLDRIGHAAALVAFALSAFFAPFVFLGGLNLALIGMILWGIGTGAQDSLLKAVLTDVIPGDRRSTGFGVFDTGFGTFYLLGNTVMGFLYDISIPALIAFSIILQLAALPVFVLAKKMVAE
jgi:MFS family permease